jgi:hypothetical protein
MARFGCLAICLVIAVDWGSTAQACLPVPRPASLPKPPSQSVIDRNARRAFTEAEYVAEVLVLRPPRFRWNSDTRQPLPGLLQVQKVMKGKPPRVIFVPLADPCLLHFQKAGERVVVAGRTHDQPSPVGEWFVASLKRQHIGPWRTVR